MKSSTETTSFDMTLNDVSVAADRRRLVLIWADGTSTIAPTPWLFDNAEEAFDSASGQRLSGALGLTAAPPIASARIEGAVVAVNFDSGATRRLVISALGESARAPAREPARLWLSPEPITDDLDIDFCAYLTDDRALAAALRRLARDGVVFLAGAHAQPGPVEQVVARFGFIRETNYGRLFDVRENFAAGHLAYTPVGLELHTDNPYRDPVPTLQVLHVIEAAAEGGESLFADGFAHAAALRAASPERFAILAGTPAPFAYQAPTGERYEALAPIIETNAAGDVTALRVNHRALRPLPLASGAAEAWYEAYLDLYGRLHAKTACLERKLAPGEVVIFDNRRILHGRTPYRSGGAGGQRWLQGCYAERDGLLATLSRLEGDGVRA